MSSNLKVNTILPSTGTAIGIGTAAGNIDILGHIVGHNTPNISGINSVTANHFYGDISNATGAAAGLGTALSQDQSNPLNKLYYTDRILSIGSTVTVDHPASATGAYTQYADILVEDNADLIVADGDDLIPDILGLGGNGTTGAGGAGRLLVDNIVNRSGTGAPTLPNGAVVTGIVTATSFFAGASQLLSGITEVDHWYLPSSWTTSGAIITSWQRFTTANVGAASPLGTGMSFSSGNFTFPSTGKWLVIGTAHFTIAGNDNCLMQTKVTVDNSNYYVYATIKDGNPSGNSMTGGSTSFAFIDVTSTSNVKLHMYATSLASGSQLDGYNSGDGVQTGVVFIRLGDT